MSQEFTADRLRDSVVAAKHSSNPVELEFCEGVVHKTYRIDCHESEKFPHLVRDETKPDPLSQINEVHAR